MNSSFNKAAGLLLLTLQLSCYCGPTFAHGGDDDHHMDLSGGMIAVMVVCIAAFVALMAGIIYCCKAQILCFKQREPAKVETTLSQQEQGVASPSGVQPGVATAPQQPAAYPPQPAYPPQQQGVMYPPQQGQQPPPYPS